jgi:branched-chain amino acid transport system ATP-binding protein
MSLLVVERLNKRFGGVVAARNVSFSVQAGEMLALIGPNGAGKSTTFNMVGGQLRPDSGQVTLGGQPITGLPPRAIAARGVGRTFQVAQIFVSMSVVQNVQMALMAKAGEAWRFWGDAATARREEAIELLQEVGMAADADRPLRELAYGDVKRAELAIALAGRPRLLLMDEPTAGMAPAERAALMETTARLARERGVGVLFTEHDMDSVFSHADRILVLVRGEVVASGAPDEVRANLLVKQVYLGDAGVTAAMRARRSRP